MIALILNACTRDADTGVAVAPPVLAEPAAAPAPEPVTAEPAAAPAVVAEAAPVATGETAPLVVEVQPGETLVDLAAWSGVTVEALAELNDRAVTAPLRVGDRLRVPDGDFEQNREAALDARLDAYFEAHDGLVGLTTRTVVTGDTAWAIARDEGLPLWVVAAYNRPLHVSALAIGDVLYLPVLGDELTPPVEEGVVPDDVEAVDED